MATNRIVLKLGNDGEILAAYASDAEVEIFTVEEDLIGEPDCRVDGVDSKMFTDYAQVNKERVDEILDSRF